MRIDQTKNFDVQSTLKSDNISIIRISFRGGDKMFKFVSNLSS